MESRVSPLLRPYLSLFMLVPENANTEPEFLKELVVDANQSAVGLIDLLSNHIYYYDMDLDQIRMCE